MSFENYKDIFGKPNEGSHSHRIPGLDIATVDVIATVILSLIIYVLMGCSTTFSTVLVSMFLAGIIAHRIFGVKTKVDRVLFGEC